MTQNTAKQKFTTTVIWYNFILCILVILIHAQNTGIFLTAVPDLNALETLIVDKIACLAVPGFFLCSGYLYYRNFTWDKLPGKLKSRFVSTVVPFVVWNLIYYGIHYLAGRIPGIQQTSAEAVVPFNLQEIFQAIVNYKYNPVFWFMQFLIIYIVLCPLLYPLLKNKWTGLIGILIVFGIDASQYLMAEHGTLAAVLNWLFIYMTGGYLGIHGRKAVEDGRHAKIMLLAMFLGTAGSFVMLKRYPGIAWTLLYDLAGAVLIWYLLTVFTLPKAKRWMKNTFYIYAVHFLIVKAGNKAARYFLGDSMYWGMALFVILPVVVIIFCHYTGRFMAKFTPGIWKLLSGNREVH